MIVRRRPLRWTLPSPLQTAQGPIAERRGWAVEISAAAWTGRGESAPLPAFGTETWEEAGAVLEEAAAQWSAARVPERLEEITALLEQLPALRSKPTARFALELALLDLLAQRRGLSVAQLVLGSEAPVPAFSINALLRSDSAAELAEEAKRACAEGFSTLKLKVAGRPLAEDLERVAAVRSAVGPTVRLRVDANGGWSESEAERALSRLAPFDLELCEQPVPADQLEALARLSPRGGIPLAADESLLRDERRGQVIRAVQVLVLKPQALGGILPALELARVAHAQGVHCYATSFLEGPVGVSGAAQLAACLPSQRFAHGLASPWGDCPVRRHALRTPEAPAFSFQGRSWSYRELDEEVARTENALEERGVRPGDRVAVLSRNRPELVALIHALARMGAVLVPLNVRLTRAELAPLLEKVEPRLVVGESDLKERLPEGAVELGALRGSQASRSRRCLASEVRCILFTSGTTGVPKGAELTFENFRASARMSAENLGGDSRQIWLGCLPLFHVGGLSLVIRCAEYGASFVLQEGFDPQRVAQALRAEKITHASLVPTGLRRLLRNWEGSFPPSLRAVLIGGGPAEPELLEEARARGLPCLQTYGLTEACSQVATERLGGADGPRAGTALGEMEIRVAAGDGEIWVRGPTVMRGYFRDPQATAGVLCDGWLRTGDLGRLDPQGRLTVLSRRTDLIVSGGENVYPAEVEAVLRQHPQVEEAAVSWAEDPEWGQRVVALVVPKRSTAGADGERELGAELQFFCRQRLAGFKVPRQALWVEELPRNAGGKVDRIAVRNLLQKLL